MGKKYFIYNIWEKQLICRTYGLMRKRLHKDCAYGGIEEVALWAIERGLVYRATPNYYFSEDGAEEAIQMFQGEERNIIMAQLHQFGMEFPDGGVNYGNNTNTF